MIGIIPNIQAQTETGYDYFNIKNPDGTYTWKSHEPYILNTVTGQWQNHIQNGNQILTNHGSIILQSNGTYSFYKKGIIDDTPLFTDTIVAKYADITNLNSWTYLNSINNDTPEISWNGDYFVSTKQSAAGKLEYKYILNNGKWKTQLEATNLSGLTTKAFGFDQIIDLESDTILFGNQQRNLDNFNGTTFSKGWIVANESKIVNFLNGIDFDFDLGFENLYSVTVYDTGPNKSRLVFDYRTSTALLPGQTLIIDPTYSSTATTENSMNAGAGTTCAGRTYSALSGSLRPTWDSTICRVTFLSYNIATIPTNAVVSSATWTYDVVAIDSVTNCILFDYSVNPTGSQSDYDAGLAGVGISASDSSCTTTGDNKIITLNATGITKIQENVSAGNGYYALGIRHTVEPTSGSYSATIRLADATLEIVYTSTPPPDRITDLTSTTFNQTSVSLDWTAPSAGGGNQQIIGYQINVTTPQTNNPLVFLNDTGSTNTDYVATGLTFGTSYSARVSAWTNNTGGHPFNNATGNVYNFTTTSTSYSGTAPTLTAFGPSSASTQINLEFPSSTMQNIRGYKIEREDPIGSGWDVLVGNTTTTTQYYNNTGLTSNLIYNYRVYAMNGTGLSDVSNEYDMTTFHLPDAVTTLSGTATDLSTIDLAWTAPTSYAPEIIGYRINATTPTGEPVDVLNSNTGTTATTATALNLLIGQEYSFRVSAITVHGLNGSGNIWNGSTIETFVIGNLTSPDITNDDDFSIFFERTDLNSTAIQLEVIHPNSYTLSCDFDYKYAMINQTYTGLSTVTNGTDNKKATFTLINATGDLVQVRCWDTLTGDEAKYVITITDFPFLQQVNNLRDGEYGTFFQIGAFDGVMLIIIFLGMVGLNRTSPIVGIIFIIITTLTMSYFELITYPIIMYPALIMMGVWAYLSTRKDD